MATVNKPTNVKQRDQDIAQKLQLYGISQAFANGKVPSNEQIDIALNSFLKSRALSHPSSRLSEEGRGLVADVRDVVERAKMLMLTKNEGNLLQDFIWQCQGIDGGVAGTPNAPVGKEHAKRQGKEALDGLRSLGTLIISNGQFRKLLNDVVVLARDMAGDVAQKAAQKVNPSEDELNNIDEPAEENTWHDTPDMGHLKDQAKSMQPFGKEGIKGAAKDAKNTAKNSDGKSGGLVDGLKQGAKNLKGQAQENVPDEHQDKAGDMKEQAKGAAEGAKQSTKGYLKEKIPQERRDQTIWRLKKMIVEIQGHQDYQSAINTLLDLAEEYAGHTKNIGHQTADTVKDAHGTDGELQTAEADLKLLIERFANSTSTDDLMDGINALYQDADRDPELKNWFKSLNKYVRKCLKQQGYIMQDSATEEWDQLYDKGHYLLRDRYRNHTDRLNDEVTFLYDQFNKDDQNLAFGNSVQKLFLDLGNDENGKPTFKPHLLKDLSEVIVPAILENINYVPIPRIEYSDPMMDAIVENLVLEGDNLAPNVFEFANDNFFRWGRKHAANYNKNKVMISVSGIQMDLKDVSYYVHKKTGFPTLRDMGVMDIFLGGSGLSFKIALETADHTNQQHFFKVGVVDVDVRNMNIVVKQSNHKLLFKMGKSIMLKVLRPVIQKALEKVIADQIHQLDGFLYGVKKEADRAKEQAKKDPEAAGNIYQRYATAAQEKMQRGKEKSQKAAADKAVNIAITKQDSMFKNISLPGGISSKATEYKELAAKGNRWESPIFSIGSASRTTGLPKVAPVKRRPHAHAPSEIRGKKNIGQTSGAITGGSDSHMQSSSGSQGMQGQGYDGYSSQQEYGSEAYAGEQSYGRSQPGYGATDAYGSSSYDNQQSTSRLADTYGASSYDNQQSVPSAQTYSKEQYQEYPTESYGSQGAGYGSQQGAGYSSQQGAGYSSQQPTDAYASYASEPASLGHGQSTDRYTEQSGNYGSEHTNGFANQISNAFEGTSSHAGIQAGQSSTTLGQANPVLRGLV